MLVSAIYRSASALVLTLVHCAEPFDRPGGMLIRKLPEREQRGVLSDSAS
jgi:hypothetical protein